MKEQRDEFLPTRASLLGRLKDWRDQESWQEFYNVYRRLIFGTALKSGLTEAEAEDVLQETVLSVAKTIKDFKYDRQRCTFKSWLRHLTQKRIADQYRRRSHDPAANAARTSTSRKTPLLERLPAPESLNVDAIWDAEWQQKVFEAAVERVKAQVNPEQYQIFDFYVLRKMPVKKVAATLEVSSGQVYLARHRISRLLKKEIKYLESRMG
jgi:RNA polymerase sigma-70 factor (ECF subfamily)